MAPKKSECYYVPKRQYATSTHCRTLCNLRQHDMVFLQSPLPYRTDAYLKQTLRAGSFYS